MASGRLATASTGGSRCRTGWLKPERFCVRWVCRRATRTICRRPTKRFPDGGQWRIEIPSVEGPNALQAVYDTADALDVPIHRVSQGSGVMLLTDDELDQMAALGRAATSRSASSSDRAPAGIPGRWRLHRPDGWSRRRCAAWTNSCRRSRTCGDRASTASTASSSPTRACCGWSAR